MAIILVAFGIAAVASGVSAALEIASDPEKRKQIRQVATWVGTKAKEAGRWVKDQVQRGVSWIKEKAKEAGGQVKAKLQQVGQGIGSFFRKAGGLLGSLVGGRG